MPFSLWSEFNPEAKQTLRPDLGFRKWDDLIPPEKNTIWKHYINKNWFANDVIHGDATYEAVFKFNEAHKAQAFCTNLLNHGGPHHYASHGLMTYKKECCQPIAQKDLEQIFLNKSQDVVYELLSYYADELSEEDLPSFIQMFNDISKQFGLNVLINKSGFIFRQDKKITEEIYVPVLNFLSNKKWEPVSRDLANATNDYLKNTDEGYSSSITLAISALQGFLQILVYGKTGKGNIGELITKAQSQNLIPTDHLTTRMFKDIESVLMAERQDKGNPHPKKEYANEKTARLIFNLVMIFVQHCLQ